MVTHAMTRCGEEVGSTMTAMSSLCKLLEKKCCWASAAKHRKVRVRVRERVRERERKGRKNIEEKKKNQVNFNRVYD
jgi:hypothetical protein